MSPWRPDGRPRRRQRRVHVERGRRDMTAPTVIEGLVSAIVPVFNRPGMLRETVASLLAQTYRPIEIILSDDGSTDGTGAVADELAAAHPDVVRVVHAAANQGAGPAREAGRRLARGEFIQYVDSDDWLLPRKFEWQVEALRRHPECGAAYGYIRLLNRDGTVHPRPYKGSGDGLVQLFPRLLYDRWWNTNCPLFRRTVCDAVGPWSHLRYSQDWEYDARIGAMSVPLVPIPEYVCVQRQHDERRQTGDRRWLDPPDQFRFFHSLYTSAVSAGVSTDSPEMRHFVRWVFSAARFAARQRDPESAEELMRLAEAASNQPSWSLRGVRILSRLLGWYAAATAVETLRRITGRRPGCDTLKQSWMEMTH